MSAPYANLRQGLLGAWCPSLVSSGGRRLRDLGPLRADAIFSGQFATNPEYVASGDGVAWRRSGGTSDINIWQVPTGLLQSIPVTWSATCWVNRSTAATINDYAIMSHMNTAPPFDGWMMYGSTNSISAYVNRGTRATATNALVQGTWRHIGITSDGATIRIFVNGSQAASGAYSTAPAVAGYPFNIGLYGTNSLYTGLLDDIRYYSRTLAPSEMMALASRRGIGLLPQRSRRVSLGGSQFWLRDAGTWKAATTWIKVGGVWKQATPKINVGGPWK